MSALDDLLARIEDAQLRENIARELEPLRAEQSLGLVFERHLPETARLNGHPVRRGVSVQYRAEDGGATWQVVKVAAGVATLRRTEDGKVLSVEAPVPELVVVREFGAPIYPGLRSEGRVERGGDKPWHTVINAENYHALETLLYTCAGQVDAIYIDPPYNTGSRDWKYNNDYVDGGDRNRHSKWLSFMEKRLRLAKRLLNPENSVLIVTIDEKEFMRLGLLLEQVFVGQRLQVVTSVVNTKGVARGKEFARVDEYLCFVYLGTAGPDDGTDNMLTFEDDAEGGSETIWLSMLRRGSAARRTDRPNMFYPVFVDEGSAQVHSVGQPLLPATSPRQDVVPPEGCVAVWPLRKNGTEGRWQVGRESFVKALDEGWARLGSRNKRTGQWAINYLNEGARRRIEEGELMVDGRDEKGAWVVSAVEGTNRLKSARSVWNRASHDASTHGSSLLAELVPTRSFPFPKSIYAVEDTLRFFVGAKPGAIVVDFFAGSGTTTHAVARLNKQDGGRRRSISVSNNEVSPEEAEELRARGHLPGGPEWEALGIFEHITEPRIRAAITGRTPGGEPVKGDYKFTDEFPMADGFAENVEFFTLTYEDPDTVKLGAAFAAVAPLLWLKAGAQGPRIDTPDGPWALPNGGRYGVLFDTDRWADFTAAINTATDNGHPPILAYIVTGSDAVFSQVAAELPPEVEPVRLYDDYLTSFTINTANTR